VREGGAVLAMFLDARALARDEARVCLQSAFTSRA
jgi:hypothetical protein